MASESKTRRAAAAGITLAAVVWLIAGCRGWSTRPAEITDTTAVLHAQTECLANTQNNPCTGWFQYWSHGSTTILTTEKITVNANTNGPIDFQQKVTGLTPDTVYHYQFCGYGDDNIAPPGLCIGPDAVTAPGQQPNAANQSATENFRTATSGTAATVDIGRVLSTADTADRPIFRDGGLSASYSANSALWMFGDTVQRNGPGFLSLGTAAAGPYTALQAPQALQEMPRPPAAPQPGLPNPANFYPDVIGLVTKDNVPCGSAGTETVPAAWLTGAARIPGTNRLLLTWAEVCASNVHVPIPERLRIAEYDPATNQFANVATPFVANPLHLGVPKPQTLANPVFGNDGYLYFTGSRRDPNPRQIFVSRVAAPPSNWGDAANYRWWGTPGGSSPQWTADQTSVVSILSGVDPWSVYVADFSSVGGGRKLAMMVKDSYFDSPHFRLYTANSPTGPWTAGAQGRVPGPCSGTYGCYAFAGHAELSTPDTFVFSWLAHGDGGRIRLGTIHW